MVPLAALLCAGPAQAAPRGKSAPQRHAAPLAVNDRTIPAHRIFALNREGAAAPLSFEQLMAELAGADVVICGEYHDDPNSHRMELALFKAFVKACQAQADAPDSRAEPALSMEMFERDVQPVVTAYTQAPATLTEAEFLAQSRPWSNYATDYRPLLEYAKAQDVLVVAANAPTALARRVGHDGWAAVQPALTEAERDFVARATAAPDDGYWQQFKSFMGGGGGTAHGAGMTDEQIHHFYEAQCLKDDTMAESIAGAWNIAHVFQVNGSFHSDYGLGTAQRTRERLPQARVYTIALRPTPDFTFKSNGGSLDPQGETLADGTPVADFVIYVPAPPAKQRPS